MQPLKKYDLQQMLAEIEDDIASEAPDLEQRTDISQDVITELVMQKIREKKDSHV